MDLFENKNISPMLIGESGEPFEDPAWIYELKLDGERAIAYLDPNDGTELRNKRNKRMLPLFPELDGIHKQVKKRCILDGEYIVMVDGKPKFSEVQRRSLMSNSFKIKLAAESLPVSFVAFDILYLDDRDLTGLPLMERKALLQKAVKETERLAVSRYLEIGGVALYRLAEQQGLEGVVAKLQDSKYYQGKRTKEWIKIKALLDDDFVVCGWIRKENHMASLVLAQYKGTDLIYKGHVTLGVSGADFCRITSMPALSAPPLPVPEGHSNDQAVWIAPQLVCKVRYMERTSGGGMRQPVFAGLRDDKASEDCVDES